MTVILVWSLLIAILLVGYYVFLKLIPSIKKTQYIITAILILVWVVVGGHNKITVFYMHRVDPWSLPILFGTFFIIQAIVRVPLAFLSAKIVSRTIVIQFVLGTFIILMLIGFLTNSDYSVWFVILGAGLVASTYGLQNVFFVENYSLRKAFTSAAIFYAVPFLGMSIGKLITRIMIWQQIQYRWMFIILILVTLPSMIALFFYKENPMTMRQDHNVPKQNIYSFFKKESSLLYLGIFLIAFSYYIINNFLMLGKHIENEHYFWLWKFLIQVLATLSGIIFNFWILRRWGIVKSKYFGYSLLISGAILNLVFLETLGTSWVFFISYGLTAMGFAILAIMYFGAALHADVKHKAFISAAFLSFQSLGSGLGKIVGVSLSYNLGSDLAVYITAIIAIAFTVGVSLTLDRKTRYIYEKAIDYEFGQR